jgi:L-fuconolactonase
MVRIDAHQHFWNPVHGHYGWLLPSDTSLYRDFPPSMLRPLLDDAAIDGTILVQAAPAETETDLLLAIAETTPWVRGVIGWVDLDAPSVAARIRIRSRHRRFVGIRPMLQDEADSNAILSVKRIKALEALAECGLAFDALIRPGQIETIASLARLLPKLTIVIDHGAKPHIERFTSLSWRKAIRQAAELPNISCKLSGLLTELACGVPQSSVFPYMDTLLDAFGSERLIWGSDWPVLTKAASYFEWVQITNEWLSNLEANAAMHIMGGNAHRIYKLSEHV